MSPVIAFPATSKRSNGQRRPRVKLLHPYPGALGWIKRRTKKIQKHYTAVTRADCIALACWDWDMCFSQVKYEQALLKEAA